jgi:hypothetical protein
MQYPKSAELKVPFFIHMQSEADYETLKQRFKVSNLNDLKKVMAAEIAKHLLKEAAEGKLNYVFERKEPEPVEEINPKEDVKELLKTRSRTNKLPWE